MRFYLKAFLLAYLYTLLTGFAVQFVVLPYLFPQAHWGEGLMVGGDWIEFHQDAVVLANRIEREGWHAWTLKPEPNYQPMAGITAFFYALTGIHKPWVMLFYNAFLHALAFITLIGILRLFGFGKKVSLLASVPFLIFPSSLTWTSQIHRDGLYIAGFYLMFLAFVLLIKRNPFYGLIPFSVGILFVYVSRQHMLIPLKYIIAILSLIFLVSSVYIFIRRMDYKTNVLRFLTAVCMIILINPLLPQLQLNQIQSDLQLNQIQSDQQLNQIQSDQQLNQLQSDQPQSGELQSSWIRTPFLPEKLDNMFWSLASVRESFIRYYSNHAGNIDHDFIPHSFWDFVKYMPRALQIGLFAPFPNMWFTKGGTPGGTVARYITPFEALFIYLCLAVFPFVVYRFRKDLSFWVVTMVSLSIIWLHVLSEPNVGAIYRKRYGFIMLMSAFSLAFVLDKRYDKIF
ncbi:hypothetical protein [Thermocrinis minervae]|uniref:Dolichyl-phosphate-mannose-protein mannosyltransferase n=1 Tax=Thermocrinis minervae TaxID=381751 RepID=A0A1M6S9X2_9AQUI|nr:hypothetical protein [Thermocrinis minervae]SHK41466.1 hypothetical protein SAMN05444391_0940 [Thermocrinis minervae]